MVATKLNEIKSMNLSSIKPRQNQIRKVHLESKESLETQTQIYYIIKIKLMSSVITPKDSKTSEKQSQLTLHNI